MATDPPGTTPPADLLGTRVPGTDRPGTRPPSGGAEPHRLAPPPNRLAPGGADLHRLRLVAITDRRRMVPEAVLTTGDWPAIAAAFAAAVERAVAGCPAGSVVVQVREKDLDGGPLLQLVRAARRFALVSVNDRLDVALAAGAWGVHLPERGLPLDIARALAAAYSAPLAERRFALATASTAAGRIDFLERGLAVDAMRAALASSDTDSPSRNAALDDARAPSIAASDTAVPRRAPPDHAAQAALAALTVGVSRHAPPGDIDVDLIQLGPIWPTPSKPGATTLGESALTWPHGRATLVAVGGIDSTDRATAAAAAGADAVAVIRAAWTGDSLASFVAAVEAGRATRTTHAT
jgi:thiamine monophosphate synthase